MAGRGALVKGVRLIETKTEVHLADKFVIRICAVDFDDQSVVQCLEANFSIVAIRNAVNCVFGTDLWLNVVYEEIICMINNENSSGQRSHGIRPINITQLLELRIRADHISDYNLEF